MYVVAHEWGHHISTLTGAMAAAERGGAYGAGMNMVGAVAVNPIADLAPLVADVVVSTAPSGPTPRRQRIRSAALRSWIGMAVLFNVIWAATWVLSANAPYYYWPIWPMIGVGIPLLISVIFGTNSGGDPGSDPGGDDGHGAIEGPRDR